MALAADAPPARAKPQEAAAPWPALRVLALSSLFPNAEFPRHGVFLAHRLRHLAAVPGLALRVVAPVPWFPSGRALFGGYGALARVPRSGRSFGLPVLHPRHPVIPKLGMSLAPLLMAVAVAPTLRRLREGGFDFDVVDAYYLYPDGVAAALLAAWFRRPCVLTAFGSDVSLIPRWSLPRAQILRALHSAAGVTAVCEALRREMDRLGFPEPLVRVVRHGVDLDLFRPPEDRGAARAGLGWGDEPVLISVGHLIPRKRHHLALATLRELPGATLAIVGDGPERQRLLAEAQKLGVAGRVAFLGSVPQPVLATLMGAADALLLCSDREGIANVLVEAMACGTPVVATPVWGAPEVVADRAAGLLSRDDRPESLAEAVRGLLSAPPDRAATRRFAEARFAWAATAREHAAVLRGAVASTRMAEPPVGWETRTEGER